MYLLSINNIPEEASEIDILNFLSYVNKYNKAIAANYLSTKRLDCYTVPKIEIVEPMVKSNDFENIKDYLVY